MLIKSGDSFVFRFSFFAVKSVVQLNTLYSTTTPDPEYGLLQAIQANSVWGLVNPYSYY